MEKKYGKAAVLGAGRIGRRHCEIYGELSKEHGIEEIIFSRRTPKNVALTEEALREYFKRKNIEVVVKGFTGIDEVLEQRPDVISICTPTDFHVEHLETVLKKCEKAIVYCEKPLCRPDQLNRVSELVERSEDKLCVGLQLYFCYPLIKKYLQKDSEIDIVWSSVPSKKENSVEELVVDLGPHVVCLVQEAIIKDEFGLVKVVRSRTEPKVCFENRDIRMELSYKQNRKDVMRYIRVKDKDNEVKIVYGGYNTRKGWRCCLFIERKKQEKIVARYSFLLDDLLKTAIEKFLSRKGFVSGMKGLRNVELVSKLCSSL